MIRRLIRLILRSEEKKLGASLDYVRHIVNVSLPAFFRFKKIIPLSEYRRVLPPIPYHVARLVAVREADCGPCVQIVVNQAKRDGVPADVIELVLNEQPEQLPEAIADVYRFTDAVVRASYDEDPVRQRLRVCYGEEGLVELAFAIASCRVFPVVKRALGYATSCAKVEITV
jgi:alkylhydroperoxidase family enzyme